MSTGGWTRQKHIFVWLTRLEEITLNFAAAAVTVWKKQLQYYLLPFLLLTINCWSEIRGWHLSFFPLAAPTRIFASGLREIDLCLCFPPFLQFPIIVWKCFLLIYDPVENYLEIWCLYCQSLSCFNCFCFKSPISFKGKTWLNLITAWGMFCTVSELEKKTFIQVELRTAKAYLTSWIEVRSW